MSIPAVAFSFSVFLLLLSAANAFNITKILSPFPDFTSFNNLLIQTGMADEINREKTLTVLLIANANMGALSGLSQEELKKTLRVHCLLDYIGEMRLRSAPKQLTQVTTLYQKTGVAQNQEGYVNMKVGESGTVEFGTAQPGSHPNSTLVKLVLEEPYSLSVLQISNFISFGSSSDSSPSSPSSSPSPSHPPASSPSQHPAPAPAPAAKSPENQRPAAAPSPRKILAPAPAPGPSSHIATAPSPEASHNDTAPNAPAKSPSDGKIEPVADAPASETPGKTKSAAVSVTSGNYLASILAILSSAWFLLTITA